MRLFTIVRLRLRTLFRREAVDRELDDELQYHLEHDVDDLVDRGMSPEEARRLVMGRMAGLQQRREE
jgi:hypothetical protein